MSRDFEKEYIELAQNEIPDLWDRIEAGLTEKAVPETEKKDRPKVIAYWKKYAGLAAAVLCAAIVIPTWMLTRQMNKSAAFDNAALEESCGAAEEACEAAEETIAEESGGIETEYEKMADTALTEESIEEAYDIAAAASEAEDGADTAGNEDAGSAREQNDFVKEREIENASEKMEAASGGAADITDLNEAIVLKNVVVRVTGEESVNDGTVYAANILKDPSGTFSEGEQIEIYIPAYSSLAMYEGGKFEIDILCEDGGNYPFVIGKIYEGNE